MKFKELAEHKEKFAAAFLKETGLDPTKVVMVQRGNFVNCEIWFRPKTEREVELDKKSETTIEQLRFCPVCPCLSCESKRK